MDEKDKMMTNESAQTAPETVAAAETKTDTVSAENDQNISQASTDVKSATNMATEAVPASQPVAVKAKNKKTPLIIAGIIALVAVVAVAAFMFLGVAKADYKEALTNIEDGEKSLTRQFEKSIVIMRTGPNRSTESDRKQLEELVKKNQQAMDEVAKLKAISKDADLKKKFEELRDQQKKLDVFSAESIETVYEVAPTMNKLGKISQQTGNEARIEYARKTIGEIKKLEPKAEFNKEFVKEVVDVFEEMFEKIDKAQDGEKPSLGGSNYVLKASQATSKWTKEVRERTKMENPVKDGFDSVKKYLKSKAE